MWNPSKKPRQRLNLPLIQSLPQRLSQNPRTNPLPKSQSRHKPTPDLIDYVVGVRGFSSLNTTTGADGVLRPALHGRLPWFPGVNKASCAIIEFIYGQPNNGMLAHPAPDRQHTAPNKMCGCGFYGYHDLSGMRNGMYGDIWAVIQGWGRVLVARDGFRCEYARVVAILDNSFMVPDYHSQQAAVAFDVPVLKFPDQKQINAVTRQSEATRRAIAAAYYPSNASPGAYIPMNASYPTINYNYSHVITGNSNGNTAFGMPTHQFYVGASIIGKDLYDMTLPDLSDYGLTIPKEMRPKPSC